MFNIVEFIVTKRDGKKHSAESLKTFIDLVAQEQCPNYQTSAWLMATFLQGMDDQETIELTEAMLYSGDTIDLSSIDGIKVDKHSTGGVADTTTLILGPIVAAAGAKVAKMSGRGLGHTGGTLDKLESIPGMSVDLTSESFFQQVREIGLAVVAQTAKLVPADKVFYSLRDVTGTINSQPLIASSIMSKKLASGSDAIVLDVKYGKGAFVATVAEAEELAKLMVQIGNGLNRKVRAIISSMDHPLGNNVGNSFEVQEAISILKGEQPNSDLTQVSLELASHLIVLSNIETDLQKAHKKAKDILESGQALEKFRQFIIAQGGNPEVIDNFKLFPQAQLTKTLKAQEPGFIEDIKADQVGMAAVALGAGRLSKEDQLDLAVGITLHKRVGDPVITEEPLATLHANSPEKMSEAYQRLTKAFSIQSQAPEQRPLINKIIS